MLRLLLKRILYALPTLWLMVSVLFLLSRILPGNYGEQQVLQKEEAFYGKGSQQSRTAAYGQLLERTNQQLPLFYFSIAPLSENGIQPDTYQYLLPEFNWHGTQNQYHRWAASLIKGSLGESYRTSRPVIETIADAAGNTFWIILVSTVLTITLALVAGITMVGSKYKISRRLLLPSLIFIDSVPLFVISLLLLLLLANPDTLQLFPVYGLGFHTTEQLTGWDAAITHVPYLVLPIVCLVLAELPYLTNQFYSSLAGTMQAEYIKTAKAKGLTESQVIRKHAFRNALLPVITVLSDTLPALLAGTIIIETVFAIPGLGRLLVTSVLARDFPVIVGIVVVVALVKMAAHIIADMLYAVADPRLRTSGR